MFEEVYLRLGSGGVQGCLPLTPEILSSLYILPAFSDTDFSSILAHWSKPAPWSKSLLVAPEQTAQAVALMLRRVILATDDLDSSSIPSGSLLEDTRARWHLQALLDLWQENPDIMPADLCILKAFLASSPSDALQPISVIWDKSNERLSALERRVVERLEEDHGVVSNEDPDQQRLVIEPARPKAAGDRLVGHLQRELLNPNASRRKPDPSFAALSVRDAFEECEAAAAIMQHWLDEDSSLAMSDIAVIIPDGREYTNYLAEACANGGLRLSSLPGPAYQRNLGGEFVHLFLQCRRKPAPAMALASLLSSPLLPWPLQIGQKMASRIMDGDFSPKIARNLTGDAGKLFDLIRSPSPTSSRKLADQLRSLGKLLPEDPEKREEFTQVKQRIGLIILRLEAASGENEIAWDDLLRLAGNFNQPAGKRKPHYLGAVVALKEQELPRRAFKKVLLLGFNDGRYPRSPAGNAFFLDSELALVRQRTCLDIGSQADQLSQRLRTLQKQIGSASEELVILCSERNREGKAIAPSASLPLLARLIEGVNQPEDMIASGAAGRTEQWERLTAACAPAAHRQAETSEIPDHLKLGLDLLAVRRTESGEPAPQSPSRLEKLLVSPLAWLLQELDLQHVPWLPQTLDVRLKGSLAHEVFELLFRPELPTPSDAEVNERVPYLFAERVSAIAPFLQSASWGVERRTLEEEIKTAAKHWSSFLRQSGAKVVGNEFWLSGELFGHPVRGKADCLLVMSDGLPVIVDYKKSGSTMRRKRLKAGWDLQVELYRQMVVRAEVDATQEILAIQSAIQNWKGQTAVAYHLLNDGGILVNSAAQLENPDVENIQENISGNALESIRERFEALKKGIVETSTGEDEKFYRNTAALGTYAFDDSPLIRAFMRSKTQAEEVGDDD